MNLNDINMTHSQLLDNHIIILHIYNYRVCHVNIIMYMCGGYIQHIIDCFTVRT